VSKRFWRTSTRTFEKWRSDVEIIESFENRGRRSQKPPLFGTIETYRSRGNPISMLLSPVLANELYTASMRFSNTAVQRLLEQQPIQQRQRTSAKNNSTQRTYNADFKHKMDTGERLRTTCVESPLRYPPKNPDFYSTV